MLKTLKTLLRQKHWAECLETWYVASAVYINVDPGLTLTYFTARSTVAPRLLFALLLCYLIQLCINIQSLWNSRDRGHLVSLAKGHMSVACQHFQRSSPLKILGQFHLNVICGLLAKWEKKFIYFIQVT